LPCLPFNKTPEKGGFPVGAPFAEKGYKKGQSRGRKNIFSNPTATCRIRYVIMMIGNVNRYKNNRGAKIL
jgi:hypothetical protein